MIKQINKEIITVCDITYNNELFKKGSVLFADLIDENGFAFINSKDFGLFQNEYDLYIPSLENK